MNQKKKKELIKLVQENPIIELACRKIGIARSTFYRWKFEDKKFSLDIEKAREESKEVVSDLAESQLITLIKDGKIRAVMFWLKSHHKDYATKVELKGKVKLATDELSEEQKINVEKALQLYGLTPNKK
ncbi:MAG: phBC6A51 family helix-turn-helix protein [Patescibacteria group bacterium]